MCSLFFQVLLHPQASQRLPALLLADSNKQTKLNFISSNIFQDIHSNTHSSWLPGVVTRAVPAARVTCAGEPGEEEGQRRKGRAGRGAG